ncbi:MAG: lipoyl protein ligase domain-containing protein [Candidatus Saccharimonadaceae bacterium]
MVIVLDYNLPDIQLLQKGTNKFLLWIPDMTYIVLGASNKLDNSIEESMVLRDNIRVLKRHTGGQTVMLTTNSLIISAVITDEMMMKPKDVFNTFNDLIIDVIEKDHFVKFSKRGISDIALDEKKIMGSSMYSNKEKLFYHAVLNFDEPATTFQKYLKHPSKEPDYRIGRSHTEFVTSLKETGYLPNMLHLKNELNNSLSRLFSKTGAADKILLHYQEI